MIRKLTLATMVVLFTAEVLAQNPPPAAARSAVPNTARMLNQRLPEVTFTETPLDQVMEWLADFTGLNLSIRWQVLEDNGVERDTPISIQARNLRLTQVLWLIMNEAGGSDIKLAYRASGSLLILSTEEDLSQEMVTKIYDVADLLISVMQAARQSTFDVTQGMGQGGAGGGGGGGGGGMFGQGSQQQGQQQGQDQYGQEGGQQQMDELVELIQQTVEPDSWRANGGLGSIFPFQRMLVVRNSILVHQRLGGYLTEDDVVGP